MHKRPIGAPAHAPSCAELRRRIEQILRTDGELESFCLDHFPETQRLFAQGMDRQQKLNLLLSREDLQCLTETLNQRAGAGSSRRSRTATAFVGSAPAWGRAPRVVDQMLIFLLAAIFMLRLSEAWMAREAPWQALPGEGLPAVLSSLDSTPSGAEVWDLRSGRRLGRTPLLLDPRLFPRNVCLRQPGWHDEVITLIEQRQPPKVVLRPQLFAETENCDVPIPILPF